MPPALAVEAHCENLEAQAQAAVPGRYSDRRNCREPVASVPTVVDGRLSFRGLDAANCQLQI